MPCCPIHERSYEYVWKSIFFLDYSHFLFHYSCPDSLSGILSSKRGGLLLQPEDSADLHRLNIYKNASSFAIETQVPASAHVTPNSLFGKTTDDHGVHPPRILHSPPLGRMLRKPRVGNAGDGFGEKTGGVEVAGQ